MQSLRELLPYSIRKVIKNHIEKREQFFMEDFMEIDQLYDSFKEILKDKSTVEHIFIGEINKRGIAVGFHHEGELANGISHVIEGTRKEEDGQGVYEANVSIHGISKFQISSFFPTDISPQDVLKIIQNAYNNKKKIKSLLYEATLDNGIIIHFYQNDDSSLGKISTAFPKYQNMEMI